MDIYRYGLFIGIVLVMFIVIKQIAKMYRLSSHGNSIKIETDFTIQSYIVLYIGMLFIVALGVANRFDFSMQQVIFWSEAVIVAMNILVFFAILIHQIADYMKYMRSGNVWIILGVHFCKNLILIYLFYNYYIMHIK